MMAPAACLLGHASSNAALVTFLIYLAGVFGLAWLSNRLLRHRHFLSEYFLGSRSLGVWAFALTFAATSASGGSFTGFPSKIYMHGWVLGLWIASYMVVPLCAMGLLGKRLNQVARISGAITVPDVLRDRFGSPLLGLLSVALIVFFMAFNLVAQFKSGSEILRTLLQDVGLFHDTVAWVAGLEASLAWLPDVDPAYLVCLITFGVAVVFYTTYGGFHAVVWTDVMQGIVMGAGVLIMLPLALVQVGGLPAATREMARMTTPRFALAELSLAVPLQDDLALPAAWLSLPADGAEGGDERGGPPRLFRLARGLTIPRHVTRLPDVELVELTTPSEIRRQLQQLERPQQVVAWNVRLQELVALQMRYLQQQGRTASEAAPGPQATYRQLAEQRAALEANRVALLNAPPWRIVRLRRVRTFDYRHGADRPGVYVSGPGPVPPRNLDASRDPPPSRGANSPAPDGFLPLSLAVSFFFMWAISGAGQPSSMVRLMAFRDTPTLRRAIFTVAIYYSLIYFPLVVIFCCARVLLPGMDLESDRIMPQMAVTLTQNIGQGWLAGLLVAAPFAAVMSTVDSFLLMISSALVRDIYQRNLDPHVSERTIRRLSYVFTMLVGAGAALGAVNPPHFLQDIIVYTGSGLAACFLGPMVFALYWPRTNAVGCLAGMLAGFLAHLALYAGGAFANGSFYEPLRPLNLDPIVLGLGVSFAVVYGVCRLTAPPDEQLVRTYFHAARKSHRG